MAAKRTKAKSAPTDAIFSLRMPSDLRAALTNAAASDDRSAASMLKTILRRWLTDKGYMQAAADRGS